VVVEAQADTVFRILDVDTMSPLLQVKTSYRKVVFGMPHTAAALPDGALLLQLHEKPGAASVYLEHETRTTARDWAGDQTL
jgi:hypothetical protein